MTARLAALALVAAAAAACKSSDSPPAPPTSSQQPPPQAIGAAEIQRGKDACKDYETRVCACATTVAAAQEACTLAHGGPEAIRLSLEVAQSPDSSRQDTIAAQKNVRKTANECIQQLAQLPSLGCPQ